MYIHVCITILYVQSARKNLTKNIIQINSEKRRSKKSWKGSQPGQGRLDKTASQKGSLRKENSPEYKERHRG